jgi:hypothetical protein
MENISKNITFENWTNYKGKEFFKVENIPTEEQITNGKLIAENIFEKLITQFGEVITIENGFLNSELNNKILIGLNFENGDALKISSSKSGEIFNYIKDNLEFDALVWFCGSKNNPQYIYVSYNAENKKQILKTQYSKELKKMEYIDFE